MSPLRRRGSGFLLLLFIFLAAVSCLLFWLWNYYTESIQELPDAVRTSFRPELLDKPGEIPPRLFLQLETFAQDMRQAHPEIREIIISKLIDSQGTERVVYPFYFYTSGLKLESERTELVRRPVMAGGRTYGYIYLRLDDSRHRLLARSFFLMFFLVLAATVTTGWKVLRQERRLATTESQVEQYRNQLLQLEKLALVGQLTANVLHDLKKPVLNIREELRELPDSPEKQNIAEQVELFNAMLRELSLERFLQTGPVPEYVDMGDIVQRSLHLVKYELGEVQVSFDEPPQLPLVYAVPHRLMQVFSNLMLNALQAMQGRGELRLRLSAEDARVEVQLTDTGPGIEPAVQARMFEPFFTLRQAEGGTGLGLYISRAIILEMGGELRCSSTPGQGTTFVVRLPAAAAGSHSADT